MRGHVTLGRVGVAGSRSRPGSGRDAAARSGRRSRPPCPPSSTGTRARPRSSAPSSRCAPPGRCPDGRRNRRPGTAGSRGSRPSSVNAARSMARSSSVRRTAASRAAPHSTASRKSMTCSISGQLGPDDLGQPVLGLGPVQHDDAAAGAAPGLHVPLALQHADGLADAGPGHAELLGQLALGRELVTGNERRRCEWRAAADPRPGRTPGRAQPARSRPGRGSVPTPLMVQCSHNRAGDCSRAIAGLAPAWPGPAAPGASPEPLPAWSNGLRFRPKSAPGREVWRYR